MRLNSATIHALRGLELKWKLINAKITNRLLTQEEKLATGTIPLQKCVAFMTTQAQSVNNCLALRIAKETLKQNNLVAPVSLQLFPRSSFAAIIFRTPLLPVHVSFISE